MMSPAHCSHGLIEQIITSPESLVLSLAIAFASAWMHPHDPTAAAPRQHDGGSPAAGPLYPIATTSLKSGGKITHPIVEPGREHVDSDASSCTNEENTRSLDWSLGMPSEGTDGVNPLEVSAKNFVNGVIGHPRV